MDFSNIDWAKLDASTFYSLITNETDAFYFADYFGLIKKQYDCICGCIMERIKDANKPHGLRFSCTKSRSICSKTKSILSGSWFNKSKLTIKQTLLILCGFALDADCKQLSFIAGLSSSKTIIDWRAFCRDVCSIEVNRRLDRKIGGAGLTVEIDETLVYTRKAHTGRLLSGESSGCYVFGGICRETNEGFLVTVANRNFETLFAAICENIEPGTRIISDCWKAYTRLNIAGYSHDRINHSYNFVDPLDPTINTQKIERMWRSLKSIIPNSSSQQTRWTYLAEFLFKQRINWYSLSVGERIKVLIDTIKEINF